MENKKNIKEVDTKISELELTVEYLKGVLKIHNPEIHCLFLFLVFWILAKNVPQIVHITIIAYFFALICEPLVNKYEKYVSRVGVFLLICFGLLAFITLVFGFLIPVIISDYSGLIAELPDLIVKTYSFIRIQLESLFGFQIDVSEGKIRDIFSSIIPSLSIEQLKPVITQVSNTLFAGYSATIGVINLFILPLLTFYFIKDWKDVNKFILLMFPKPYWKYISSRTSEVQIVINNFAKGQVIVGCALVILYSVALKFIGLPYAIPIGIVSGVLAVIPYVGLIVGVMLAFLVQGTYDPTLFGFIKVLLSFFVVQFLESNFITPKVVGDSMGLHPLIVVISLLIGGSVFGILGLVIAIPITAIIKLSLPNPPHS